MRGRRFWIAAIAVILLVSATTGYASAQEEPPAAEPTVQIPAGWKRVGDDRLGYSLAVPFTWLTFNLHSGAVNPIAGLLGGDLAVEILRNFLNTPDGRNFGILAIEPDTLQLFANPPFPMFLNVSVVPWSEGITAEQLVSFLQNSAEDLNEVELHTLLTGSLNGLLKSRQP